MKCTQGAGVIDRLEFGDGCARCEESGEDHEHLVNVEIGIVVRFYWLKLKTFKEQIARDMDYKLANQWLGSVSLKPKSCPFLTKSNEHETAANQRSVTFCIFGSFDVCSSQKEPPSLYKL